MLLRFSLRVTPIANLGAALAIGNIAVAVTVKPWLGHALTLNAVRMTLAVVAIGVASAFDDSAATTVASSPTSLPRRRSLRLLVMAVPAVVGVGATAAVVRLVSGASADLPVARLALEGVALAAFALAAGALNVRRGGSAGSAVPAAVTAIGLLFAAAFVFGQRFPEWSLMASPAEAAWTRAGWMWALVLGLGASTVVWLSRDPAARRPGRYFPRWD